MELENNKSLLICNEIKTIYENYYLELKKIKIKINISKINKYLGCYDPNKKIIWMSFSCENGNKFEPSQFIFTLLHEFSHVIADNNNVSVSNDNPHGKQFYDIFRNIICIANKLNIYHIIMNGMLERVDSVAHLDPSKSVKIGYSIQYPDSTSKSNLIRIGLKNGKNVKYFCVDLKSVDSEDSLKKFIKNKLNISKTFDIKINTNILKNNCIVIIS